MSLFTNATCPDPPRTPKIIQSPTTLLMGLTSRSNPHNIFNGSHVFNGPLPSASKCKFAPSSSGETSLGSLGLTWCLLGLCWALLVPPGPLLVPPGPLLSCLWASPGAPWASPEMSILRSNTVFKQKQTRTPHFGCVSVLQL